MSNKERGERNFVIVMNVGLGPYIWNNLIMYLDSANTAFKRLRKRYPKNTVRLCGLADLYTEVKDG